MDFAIVMPILLVRNVLNVMQSIMDFQIVKVGYSNCNYLSHIWIFLLNHFFQLLECTCNLLGADDNDCNTLNGHCYCKTEYITGNNCEQCIDGYFSFPNCEGITFSQSKYINLIKKYLESEMNVWYLIYGIYLYDRMLVWRWRLNKDHLRQWHWTLFLPTKCWGKQMWLMFCWFL